MYPRRGVTMVELIVVLAIIVVLVGLLLPAVQIVRERARETICKNNVHQINLAVAQFTQTHKNLPRPGRPGKIGGWMIEIMPFIELQHFLQIIRPNTAVTDAPGSLFQPPAIFRCPRSTTLDSTPSNVMWRAHYVLVTLGKRESFLIYDAPVDFDVPWVSGLEMDYRTIQQSKGPHHGGFYYANGFQQGVSFMLDGKDVR